MSVFSKILENLGKTISKELDKNASKNASKEATKQACKNTHKQIHKEQRGIYNVTYNGKNATYIKTDLDSIDNAIRYARGDRKQGAQHIKIRHTLESNQQGHLTQKELLNAGQYIREYLAKHKEPFIDERGARIYEWENKEGDRFRIVAMSDEKQEGARLTAPLSQPLVSDIITFYSDRNYKDKMIFKNPALNQSKKQDSTQNLPFTRE